MSFHTLKWQLTFVFCNRLLSNALHRFMKIALTELTLSKASLKLKASSFSIKNVYYGFYEVQLVTYIGMFWHIHYFDCKLVFQKFLKCEKVNKLVGSYFCRRDQLFWIKVSLLILAHRETCRISRNNWYLWEAVNIHWVNQNTNWNARPNCRFFST